MDRQFEDAEDSRTRLGWGPFAKICRENDTSAFKKRKLTKPDGTIDWVVLRAEFRQLLADLALGVIDGVILYDLDRLVRQPRTAGIKPGESGATPVVRYFLSGILRCNSCHRGLVGHRHKQRRTGIIIRNHECPPSDRGGCGGTPISAPTADLAVEEVPLPGPPPRPPLPRARSCSASRCKTRSAITRSSRSAWTS
ncbi:hypothetical protein ACFCXR_17350 [Streptomyces noursei]|uniref:zinc ribbon domain-containing protein n=1 Tax=Streptomyces noursei TaxID=1971 RepID=UPI0035D90E20